MQNSTKIFSILWSFVFSLKFQNRVVLLQVLWPEKYPCFITSWTEVKWSEVKWRHSIMSDSLWPMDCSLPGYSIHGIFQARVLEWIAISFSRGSSQPRDRTRVSCVVDRRFTIINCLIPMLSIQWRQWEESQQVHLTNLLLNINCLLTNQAVFYVPWEARSKTDKTPCSHEVDILVYLGMILGGFNEIMPIKSVALC